MNCVVCIISVLVFIYCLTVHLVADELALGWVKASVGLGVWLGLVFLHDVMRI